MLKLANNIINPNEALEDNSDASSYVALLLAGGDGTRLQELTRLIAGIPIPKQYCRLLHGASLLEATLSRALLFAERERINVVINQNHLMLAKEQLKTIPESNIFVQPLNRDTGPGMIFALMNLQQAYSDAIVAVFPTDHYIDDDPAFIAHIHRAVRTITHMPDKVAMLGITPERPETGYGYILPENPVAACDKVFHVKAFTEKPNLLKARDIISRGGLWNSFVMVFRISRMIELLKELVPNEIDKLLQLKDHPEKASELYHHIESWNLSSRVLAQIPQHLIMFEVDDVHWSDLGTRESLERTYRALNLVPFWNISNSVSDPIPS
jgi:mannose-1-phosphate guanylyltransferase